jgi:hypothetical protein
MVPQLTKSTAQDHSADALPRTCRDIETVADVIVWTHTAVGRTLQAVATRENGSVRVQYDRSDIDRESFVRSIEQLPPVPAEPGFVTYGFDDRQVLWLAIDDGGIAVALDRETNTNLSTLAEGLYDCGIGTVEPATDQR